MWKTHRDTMTMMTRPQRFIQASHLIQHGLAQAQQAGRARDSRAKDITRTKLRWGHLSTPLQPTINSFRHLVYAVTLTKRFLILMICVFHCCVMWTVASDVVTSKLSHCVIIHHCRSPQSPPSNNQFPTWATSPWTSPCPPTPHCLPTWRRTSLSLSSSTATRPATSSLCRPSRPPARPLRPPPPGRSPRPSPPPASPPCPCPATAPCTTTTTWPAHPPAGTSGDYAFYFSFEKKKKLFTDKTAISPRDPVWRARPLSSPPWWEPTECPAWSPPPHLGLSPYTPGTTTGLLTLTIRNILTSSPLLFPKGFSPINTNLQETKCLLSCNICPVIMTASEANQDMSSDLNASQGRMQGRTGQAWPPTILTYVIFICYSDCQDPLHK